MVLPDNLRCNMPLFSSLYLNSCSLKFLGFLPRLFPSSLCMVFLFRLPGFRPRFFGGFCDVTSEEGTFRPCLSLGAVEAVLGTYMRPGFSRSYYLIYLLSSFLSRNSCFLFSSYSRF